MFTTSSNKLEAIVAEKDAQIVMLQSELAFLRTIINGFLRPEPLKYPDRVEIEANALLSGAQEQIDLNQPTVAQSDILTEREQLLSGTY